jgi:hypothetical protein
VTHEKGQKIEKEPEKNLISLLAHFKVLPSS